MDARQRLGDRRARDGRDGRDGFDGKDGRDGLQGFRGQKGDPGSAGRDLALVAARAEFERDQFTHQTLRVQVFELATSALLLTLLPAYDADGFIESTLITPA